MIRGISRKGAALAAAAALSMAVAPVAANARGWGGGWGGGWGHRHHDRVDAGDIFAGILIIGGIAAIASAASKADKDRRARTDTRDRDYRDYPNRDYRDDRGSRYGEQDNRPTWQEGRGIDNAVNQCVDEVQRTARVDSVEGANRDGDGWRVEGRVVGGRSFTCAIGNDGRIRSTTIDGRSASAGDEPRYISEPVVQKIDS